LVDKVVLEKEKFSYNIIKEINLDIICLGYNQKVDKKKMEEVYDKK